MPRLGGRKRPRVKSYRLRGLWWVVFREAAMHIYWPGGLSASGERQARALLAATHADDIRRHIKHWLRVKPARRVWPRVGAPR